VTSVQFSGRRLFRCVLATLVALAAVTFMLEGSVLSGVSPLEALDPSDGGDDPQLADALRRALVEQPSGPLTFVGGDEKRGLLEVRLADADEIPHFSTLVERLRRVPGWDLIVLIGPLETGKRAAQDPRITSWWLRRRIAMLFNPDSEGWQSILLVARDDKIVTSIRIQFACFDAQTVISAESP